MMKRIALMLSLLVLGTLVYGQNEKQTETIFKEGFEKSIGVMAAVGMTPAQWGSSTVALLNMRAGAVFSDKVSLGGFYNLSLNDFSQEFVGAQGPMMDFRWVGGFVEYTLFADRRFHLTFPLLIGGAELEIDEVSMFLNQKPEVNFLLIEPSALLEITLLQNLRFNIGLGYRFAGDFNYGGLDQSDLSGFTAQAALKVGLWR
jgi:hypothetical protein